MLAALLTLFRLIYEGGRHGAFQLPARKGYLFDPDRYPFLEGRAPQSSWRTSNAAKPRRLRLDPRSAFRPMRPRAGLPSKA